MKTKIFKRITLGLAGLLLSAAAMAQLVPSAAPKAPEAPLAAPAALSPLSPAAPVKPAEWTPKAPESPNMESYRESRTAWTENDGPTVEKSKKISRSFNVDAKDKLSVKNQFGKVTINTWAKNEIKVDIEIKGFDKDEAGAQKYVDMVNIEEKRSDALISFITQIERNKSDGWWGSSKTKDGKETRRGVEINYTVYMPGKNPLDIDNKYGATVLPDFDGPLNIENAYGSFTAQKIDHRDNKINVRYGSATIGSLQSGNLNVAYGNLKLTSGENISAKVNYGSAKIGTLSGGGSLSVGYGSLKVEEFNKAEADMNINASYSSVNMGIGVNANFNFDISTNYGGFNYNSAKVDITAKTPSDDAKGWSSNKNYKGKYGKGSNAMLTIKSNYGSVKFE